MTFPNKNLVTALPVLLAAASCVPPPETAASLAPLPAVVAEAATPGFSFEGIAPPSSLGRLEPAQEAQWQKAAGLFAAPSSTPAAPFKLEGEEWAKARALDCLTSAVYHEARSERVEGQRAVAQVVLNRVRHPAFPASVCGVVFQGSGRRTGCQFSFTCDGSLGRRREPGAWERAREIAAAALDGEVYARVGNATHYHTRAILPYWASSLTRSAAVGAHIFYRWRGGAGTAGAFSQEYSGAEGAPTGRTPPVRRAALSALPGTAQVERVKAGGAIVRIHRAIAPAAGHVPQEQSGVRVHAGTLPPSAAEGA